jgi:hypothetical protein
MAIDPSDKIHALSPLPITKSLTGKPNAARGTDFADVLDKSVKMTPSQTVIHQQQPNRVTGLCADLQGSTQMNALASAHRMLDAMERYQHFLADWRVNPREMEPAIEQMKMETDLMQSAMEKLPQTSALRDILDETLMLATKEIARFDQGDYVDCQDFRIPGEKV